MLLTMNTSEMINQLGTDTEDEAHVRHPALIKQRALNNATLALAQMLANPYLEELKEEDLNQELVSGAFPLSSLSYSVLRSGAGILKVKIKDGLWCTKMELEDIKITEHDNYAGSERNPLFYIHKNEIVVSAGNATHIDIYYIRNPNPLLHTFTLTVHATPSKYTFTGPADEGLSAVDDAYNNAVVYITQEDFYAVVEDYTGATRSFEIFREDAAANLTTGDFYFTTSPFKITGLDNLNCELNASLHPLVLLKAAAELWSRDEKHERAAKALKKVDDEVDILNARYEPAVGIGRRRTETQGVK